MPLRSERASAETTPDVTCGLYELSVHATRYTRFESSQKHIHVIQSQEYANTGAMVQSAAQQTPIQPQPTDADKASRHRKAATRCLPGLRCHT